MVYYWQVININELKDIIDEFRLSTPQSEEEIRSKFIVPLLLFLGYPSHLRADEFPVYGFEGSKKLKTKEADYILFTDSDYARHRTSSKESISWVQQHSLLVVEAKKPGEVPEILGQPQYYTIWTRAIAYIVTDGYVLRGCMYEPISSDYEVVSCFVDDLPNRDEINIFSYERLLELKNRTNRQVGEIENSVLEVINGELVESDFYSGVTRVLKPDEEIHLPAVNINYMKKALGRDADGLDNYHTVKKYLSMTDSYLQNDIRYGAPEYMISIPRKSRPATIYIDNQIVPTLCGEVTVYYQNEKEMYSFENDIFTLDLAYENDRLVYVAAGYKCVNTDAELRIHELKTVLSILAAKKISIWIQEYDNKTLTVEKAAMRFLQKEKQNIIHWIEEVNKIAEIQKYYGIKIYLNHLENGEETINLYRNVDIVYDGIKMQSNIVTEIDRNILEQDITISEPLQIIDPQWKQEEMGLTIHNHHFIPNELYLLPVRIKQRGKRMHQLHFCVTFAVSPGNG